MTTAEAHPRVSGENIDILPILPGHGGSSPRERGKRVHRERGG